MRTCSTCKIEKEDEEFHKSKWIKSGFDYACKVCKRLEKKRHKDKYRDKILEDARRYAKRKYAENPERLQERHKEWIKNNPEKYKEGCKKTARKMYLKNPEKVKNRAKKWVEENREWVNERNRQYKKKNYEHVKAKHYEYWARYPEKYKATRAVNNAIAQGKMIRPTICSKCFLEGSIEGHHPDYSKPLEVIWLCIECHNKEHGKHRVSK